MITGDNPLTACHVAKELRFTRSKVTLILTHKKLEQKWGWESVNEDVFHPFEVVNNVAHTGRNSLRVYAGDTVHFTRSLLDYKPDVIEDDCEFLVPFPCISKLLSARPQQDSGPRVG